MQTMQLPPISRRRFLETIGAAGAAFGLRGAAHAFVPRAMQDAAAIRAKKITLLTDGGFAGDAWGWQFTSGAKVDTKAGPRGLGAVQVATQSGDYARFLVLGPVAGKTYTLTGWVRTENIRASEAGAGAYFAASQFEFQGRPTEFTVDGKQAVEIRYGNWTGTNGWTKFSQSVKCLPTTAWFEVVAGVYRAEGEAWFSGLTFVEDESGAELADTVTAAEAAELAHVDALRAAGRTRARAAILNEPTMPVRGTATDPKRLAELLASTHDAVMLSAAQISDAAQLNRKNFDLVVLGCGESFPLAVKDTIADFLKAGGDLLTTGGHAFESPVTQMDGRWVFLDETLTKPGLAPNLVPKFSDARWKSDAEFCSLNANGAVARVEVKPPLRGQHAQWSFDIPAKGDGRQFYFAARWRTMGVVAAPVGSATIGVEQLDADHNPAYAARMWFEELRGDSDWHDVARLFYLVPDCVTLRVRVTMSGATGAIEATNLRLEERPDAVRVNTSLGWPEDSLTVARRQIGIFDSDDKLKRVHALHAVSADGDVIAVSSMAASGFAATGVVGMNNARWVPVLQAVDGSGRRRGAAGSVMHHYNGYFNRSSWAFFGVDNADIAAAENKAGVAALKQAAESLAKKCFLHTLETDYSTYRDGEPVQMRVLVSNYGLAAAAMELKVRVLEGEQVVHAASRNISLRAGETQAAKEIWAAKNFSAAQYRVVAELRADGKLIASEESGFCAWKDATLAAGMPVEFRENYFQVQGKSIFLQGVDDYLHTFIDQDENAHTWLKDAQGCKDSAIDVYENLMGLRGPQQRPTETWWRWVDAMLLNTQAVGGIFFPGMLVFSNTAVSDADLADQKAYVRAFAARYGKANGIMYYLNGDLELHDPNLPDLEKIYNDFLRDKYKTDAALREAWTVTAPEAPLGQLKIRRGSADWRDVRTLDDFQFRTFLVRRWLNALYDSIREVDAVHPVTAEFYQEPVSGIDLLTALGKLELANFGYFHEKDSDYYRFPQVCRFLDQSTRGKGVNIGEFGVKTHPAWNDTGYYIEARTEEYEHQYFLSLTHYGFAMGASKMQNWCWKYPADLPFEWGINYPNDLVPRDVRAYYRNSGVLFRSLRPKYEPAETMVLLASENRMGGQGMKIVEGQLNAIRLLLDANVRFGTLTDEFISELPAETKTIFYPLPYCPSDEIVAALKKFVERGGQMYLSGDVSYDGLRRRTKTARLRELCGVEFVSERYANLQYEKAAVLTAPDANSAWPKYEAAPTMAMRLAGAKALLKDDAGNPVVTEFSVGKGRVIFSADPVELHGDAQYQRYGHAFYAAVAKEFSLNSDAPGIEMPADVHYFDVPTQDGRVVKVLVNHGEQRQSPMLMVEKDHVQIALQSRMPGVVVRGPGNGVSAVESSGDVMVGGAKLIESDLHLMAIGFDGKAIAETDALLLLPMGTGTVKVHRASAMRQPVMVMGEMVDGKWKSYLTTKVAQSDGAITVRVNEELALAMLIVCEADAVDATIAKMETWMLTPWKM